jgi:hypothetical protein
MNRRVVARIKVMAVTILFIGGFSAFNPACSQRTHASDVDAHDAFETRVSDRPIER